MASPAIQSANGIGAFYSPPTPTLTGVVAGNTLVAAVWQATGTTTSVTAGGVAMTEAVVMVDAGSGNREISIWVLTGVAGGNTTFAVSVPDFVHFTVAEYAASSGVRALGSGGSATGSGTVSCPVDSTATGEACIMQVDTQGGAYGQTAGTIGGTDPVYPLANTYSDLLTFDGVSPGGTVNMTSTGGSPPVWNAVAIALLAAGGGPTYTLTAAAGAFTSLGQAVGLRFNRKVTAASGAFTMSGKAAGLLLGRKLTAASGSFALSGKAAGLLLGRKLTAASGAFVFSGKAANLVFSGSGATYTLTAASGSFSVAGQSAGLLFGRKLTAAQGTFSLSGQAAGLRLNRLLTAARGTFTFTGQNAALVFSGTGATYTLVAAAGSFTSLGQSAGLLFNRKLTAAQGTFSLSGQAAGLRLNRLLTAARGTFTFTGQNATLIWSGASTATYTLVAASGTFTVAGQAASLRLNRRLAASRGAFAVAGQPAAVLLNRILTASPGAFTLAGQSVTFRTGRVLFAARGAFQVIGNNANIVFSGAPPEGSRVNWPTVYRWPTVRSWP
jgi:hypothetical protein